MNKPHEHKWREIPGGAEKCADCGEQRSVDAPSTKNPMGLNNVVPVRYSQPGAEREGHSE